MPGREVPEIVPTQRVQPGQPECPVKILIGVPAPEGVAPALGHIGPHPTRDPEVEPVQHPGTLCALEVLSPAPQVPINRFSPVRRQNWVASGLQPLKSLGNPA